MNRQIRAVILDMDGLMLDTESVERDAFRRAAAEFGYGVPDDIYLQVVGRTGKDAQQIFHSFFGDNFPFDGIRTRWREYVEHHVSTCGVPFKKGLLELLTVVESRALPKAVATSTRRARALRLLEKSNLLSRFHTVVTADDVTRGKPDPEIFLTAAKRLNVAPEECVVFEDSAAGIRAAHAARMMPILVPDLVMPGSDVCGLAHRICESLLEAHDVF
jgi:HAD superfamily hydrolase (TIGR01509 family)